MKVQVQSIHFDADQKLLEFIQKKLDKLDTFYDRIIDAEVLLRVERADNQENKHVEVIVRIPGDQLFAENRSRSFEAAIDLVADKLRRQMQKYKEKVLAVS